VTLAKVTWITDKSFPTRIEKHSPSVAKAVASFQLIVAHAPEMTMRTYSHAKFHAVLRHGFPAEITVSYSGDDNWVLYLNKADKAREGPGAPILLEISENVWTLFSQAASSEDGHKRRAVASGTVK
jgi:hypothetical protein